MSPTTSKANRPAANSNGDAVPGGAAFGYGSAEIRPVTIGFANDLSTGKADAISAYRLAEILDPLFADVVEDIRGLLGDIVAHTSGNAHRPRFAEAL